MKLALLLVLTLLAGCATWPASNDVMRTAYSQPDRCDPKGYCNVGKRP